MEFFKNGKHLLAAALVVVVAMGGSADAAKRRTIEQRANLERIQERNARFYPRQNAVMGQQAEQPNDEEVQHVEQPQVELKIAHQNVAQEDKGDAKVFRRMQRPAPIRTSSLVTIREETDSPHQRRESPMMLSVSSLADKAQLPTDVIDANSKPPVVSAVTSFSSSYSPSASSSAISSVVPFTMSVKEDKMVLIAGDGTRREICDRWFYKTKREKLAEKVSDCNKQSLFANGAQLEAFAACVEKRFAFGFLCLHINIHSAQPLSSDAVYLQATLAKLDDAGFNVLRRAFNHFDEMFESFGEFDYVTVIQNFVHPLHETKDALALANAFVSASSSSYSSLSTGGNSSAIATPVITTTTIDDKKTSKQDNSNEKDSKVAVDPRVTLLVVDGSNFYQSQVSINGLLQYSNKLNGKSVQDIVKLAHEFNAGDSRLWSKEQLDLFSESLRLCDGRSASDVELATAHMYQAKRVAVKFDMVTKGAQLKALLGAAQFWGIQPLVRAYSLLLQNLLSAQAASMVLPRERVSMQDQPKDASANAFVSASSSNVSCSSNDMLTVDSATSDHTHSLSGGADSVFAGVTPQSSTMPMSTSAAYAAVCDSDSSLDCSTERVECKQPSCCSRMMHLGCKVVTYPLGLAWSLAKGTVGLGWNVTCWTGRKILTALKYGVPVWLVYRWYLPAILKTLDNADPSISPVAMTVYLAAAFGIPFWLAKKWYAWALAEHAEVKVAVANA